MTQSTATPTLQSYWLSWYHTRGMGEFELHTPWWVSGTRMEDDAATVVAAVMAADEEAAQRVVVDSYDKAPDKVEWRFVEPGSDEPFTDRFPRADWMVWPPEAVDLTRPVEPVEVEQGQDVELEDLPVVDLVPAPRELLESLVDPDDCWFDHDGGCQAHGYIALGHGEVCPQAELKDLLKTEES